VTLEQFRELTKDLPGDTQIYWCDTAGVPHYAIVFTDSDVDDNWDEIPDSKPISVGD